MTLDLKEAARMREEATQGVWAPVALGGASTIITAVKPPRNDTRIPAYGYDERHGYCIAYPFVEDGGQVRRDFVCFGHGDAAFIAYAANNWPTLLALASQAEAMREELAREERRHTQTIEERDAVQTLFDELYVALFSQSPEYSNLTDATDAFNGMEAEIARRKSAVEAMREAHMREIVALYDRLAAINDEIEVGDDGYARFASVNDRDRFGEIVRELEDRGLSKGGRRASLGSAP